MKMSFRLLLLAGLVVLSSFDIPAGWFIAGSKPKSYQMGIDKGAGQGGTNAATIKSIDKDSDGFGTLMQQSLPGVYLGKRVRMTGFMKSTDVTAWAGLWLRVDQANSAQHLSFDNMNDRPVKGTTAWTKYEIVLDVPVNASKLAYGALLHGSGQIWFDDLQFEVVDETVPVTGRSNAAKSNGTLDNPTNLDFDK
jgi:hypothetical protein